MIKYSIGVPCFNAAERGRVLLTSLLQNTDGFEQEKNFRIVIGDDGSTKNIDDIKTLAKDFNTGYVRHEKNKGISSIWNSLTNYNDCEISILFNDDMRIRSESNSWLKCLDFFFENNEFVGVAGFPLYHVDLKTDKPGDGKEYGDYSRWAPFPALVGAPVGNAFGFRKKVWEQVKNIDGSIGFWEDLVSFSEEIYFGFRAWELDFYNFQLPNPPIDNMGGGQTFANNPIVNVRKPSNYLPLEEYLKEMTKFKPRHMLVNSFGEVSRMDYSRMMFAKAYGSKDYWDNPYKEVHERIVTPKPAKKVKWLNKNLNEEEAWINNSGIWTQQ